MWIFGCPSLELFIRRNLTMFMACPSAFFGSFLWAGFGICATNAMGLTNHSIGYYFMTGLGTALGTLVGQAILLSAVRIPENILVARIHDSVLQAIAAGTACGTLWQFSVNISQLEDYDFTNAFFFVWMMSSIAAFSTFVVFREANECLPFKSRFLISTMTDRAWYDFLTAITIGCCDAFFVGTDDYQYRGGWLEVFSTDNCTVLATMILSGMSSLCGFLAIEFVQNSLLKDTWVDGLYFTGDKPIMETIDLFGEDQPLTRNHDSDEYKENEDCESVSDRNTSHTESPGGTRRPRNRTNSKILDNDD